jgi:hypothetical protein
MSNFLDDLINNAGDMKYSHPMIDEWGSILNDQSLTDKVVQFYREKKGLTYFPAMLYLKWKKDGKSSTSKHEYHKELDLFLYQNKIKAINPDNEFERGGFWLKNTLENGDVKFGDGYFSAVLLQVVEKYFGYDKDIEKSLGRTVRGNPSGSVHYDNCKKNIVTEIENYLKLLKNLGYSVIDIKNISVKAVNYYLDERFHISNRELLGFD